MKKSNLSGGFKYDSVMLRESGIFVGGHPVDTHLTKYRVHKMQAIHKSFIVGGILKLWYFSLLRWWCPVNS